MLSVDDMTMFTFTDAIGLDRSVDSVDESKINDVAYQS